MHTPAPLGLGQPSARTRRESSALRADSRITCSNEQGGCWWWGLSPAQSGQVGRPPGEVDARRRGARALGMPSQAETGPGARPGAVTSGEEATKHGRRAGRRQGGHQAGKQALGARGRARKRAAPHMRPTGGPAHLLGHELEAIVAAHVARDEGGHVLARRVRVQALPDQRRIHLREWHATRGRAACSAAQQHQRAPPSASLLLCVLLQTRPSAGACCLLLAARLRWMAEGERARLAPCSGLSVQPGSLGAVQQGQHAGTHPTLGAIPRAPKPPDPPLGHLIDCDEEALRQAPDERGVDLCRWGRCRAST